MKLSHAVQLFLLSKEIAGFSPNTIRNYRLTLGRLCEHFGDKEPNLRDVAADDLRVFLHSLQKEPPQTKLYIPRPPKALGPKSIRNVHASLSSFWEWALVETHVDANIVQMIKSPRPKPPTIDPFEEREIDLLLAAIRKSSSRLLRLRDKAIVFFLLDTGVRASELCNLKILDVAMREGSASVRGKGRLDSGTGKERVVLFGTHTSKALHEYLIVRGEQSPNSYLFATFTERKLDRRHLATHLRRLGARAGIAKCNAHRFRHTFAIMYLRNNGDIFTLQRLLGHSSLDMVKRYLSIAQTDIKMAFRKAGPVDNLEL